METPEISSNNQISQRHHFKIQPDDIHRIIASSQMGAFLFLMFIESCLSFWPWLFAFPQIPLSYLWLLIKTWSFYPLIFGAMGLFFGALVGIPRPCWVSPAIWTVLGAVFLTIVRLTQYTHSIPQSKEMIILVCTCVLVPCFLAGLLVIGTLVLHGINPDQEIALVLAILGIISVLTGTALFLSRPVVSPTDSVMIISIYQNAKANGWQVKSFKQEGLIAESGTGILFTLKDGTTRECIYWEQFGMEYESDYPDGFPKNLDLRDIMSCPP